VGGSKSLFLCAFADLTAAIRYLLFSYMSYQPPLTVQSKKRSEILFGKIVYFIERQRPSDRLFLLILFFVSLAGLLMSIIAINNKYIAPTPVAGGVLIEGVVGVPRFINPVLAVTRADQDLVALTFSSLMKISPDGTLVPDVAKSVTPSSDGTTYNIIIREDIRFHDGTPLTARDVIFTIGLLKDADLKSPLRGNWTGVLIEELGEYEFNIILNEPYIPFIENLTFGILPRHIWNELPTEQIPFSQRNTDPIGSGPFRIKQIARNSAGFIQSYVLERFTQYHEDVMLQSIQIRFYSNEDALLTGLQNREITSTAYIPLASLQIIENNPHYKIITEPLPRVFAIFINQNRSVPLRDSAARRALGAAVNRDTLIDTVLFGYGVPTNDPIPPHHFEIQSTSSDISIDEAEAILIAGNWRKNSDGRWEKRIDNDLQTLSITLRTTNNPTFEQTAQFLRASWEALGVEVFIEQYEQSDLLQSVIRTRDFEGLLFGVDMNRTVDLYPFWHSSQREDPGLNIAQYANITVDSLLTRARSNQSPDERADIISDIIKQISTDVPAIFLFVPNFIYVVNADTEVASIKNIGRPHERFMNVHTWHKAVENVWSVFR